MRFCDLLQWLLWSQHWLKTRTFLNSYTPFKEEEELSTSQVSPRSHRTICPLRKHRWRTSWVESPAGGCRQPASWRHTAPRGRGRGERACRAARGPWHRWRWWRSPSCCLEHSCPPDFRNLSAHERIVRIHLHLLLFLRESLRGGASLLQAVAC